MGGSKELSKGILVDNYELGSMEFWQTGRSRATHRGNLGELAKCKLAIRRFFIRFCIFEFIAQLAHSLGALAVLSYTLRKYEEYIIPMCSSYPSVRLPIHTWSKQKIVSREELGPLLHGLFAVIGRVLQADKTSNAIVNIVKNALHGHHSTNSDIGTLHSHNSQQF